MKRNILILIHLLLFSITGFAQTKLSQEQLRQTTQYFDLKYTDQEIDSLMNFARFLQGQYQRQHQLMLNNDVPFSLSFQPPAPPLTSTQNVDWKKLLPAKVAMPKDEEALAFYSVAELAVLLRTKQITSVALTEFFLARLKKYNKSLECVISFTDSIALAQAQRADAEIKAGKWRGPLHGIPYGLKDLFAVKGTRTTWGATPYKDQSIDLDAAVYEKLNEAGAVLIAKLSLGALAMNDRWFGGWTRNPWNTNEGSSGSSAGSAAAVAAGLVPFAIGTETNGSILSPSARCGATGFRPSYGSVSRYGAMTLSWTLDKVGPLCRSAMDCALVFAAIQGKDARDGNYVTPAMDWSMLKKPMGSLRVAYAVNYFERIKDTNRAEWQALRLCKAKGISLVPIIFPDSLLYPYNLLNVVLFAEAAAAFDELTRTNRDELMHDQSQGAWPNIFRSGQTIPAVAYINANRHRAQLLQQMQLLMKEVDVIIFPMNSGGSFIPIGNLTGQPAISVPIGARPNTTSPANLVFLGKWYEDATLLAVANAFQQLTTYHHNHPSMK